MKDTGCQNSHKKNNDNMKWLTSIKEIESVINIILKQKAHTQMGALGTHHQTLKEEAAPVVYSLFQWVGAEESLVYSVRPASPNTKTRQASQENYQLRPIMNTDAKILNKILANVIN